MERVEKSVVIVFMTMFFFTSSAAAQEITAIDFNGDLLGKVIPDGKVVGFNNQLIGNVTADSLIVNFDGKLIGGVVPQGIAIGSDAKPLGKVGNDGTVRLASGQTVGRVLPNGLVVNDYFDIIGGVIFPGLVYADDGSTIGRITGDGQFTNLQGQTIGLVTPDGYAYQKVGTDYILAGRLISSKMVVSLQGEFIGSVILGGEVSNFDSEIIGRIKANGYVYNAENQIIGHIVKSGYAFDNNGYYLGVVTYNGEVVSGDRLLGRIRADGNIVDLENNLIGYSVDIAGTATDLRGRYIGRLMPEGNLSRAKTTTALVGARGIVNGSEGTPIGQISATGPVFDYKGSLKGHALPGGSVIALNGTSIGYMIGKEAYDLSGRMMGAVLGQRSIVALNNKSLGMSGIGSQAEVDKDRLQLSPLGYVFDQEGNIKGSSISPTLLYSANGSSIAVMGLDGKAVNIAGNELGTINGGGYVLNSQNQLIAKNIDTSFALKSNGEYLGNLTAENLVMSPSLDIIAKILPDYSIVKASSKNSINYVPKVGNGYKGFAAQDFSGNILGYTNILGQVNNLNGVKIGQVVERGYVTDNNGQVIGHVLNFGTMINSKCGFEGVITPKGDVQNYRGTYLGRVLPNGFVISDSGTQLGHISSTLPVIDASGRVLGFGSGSGKVIGTDNSEIGCLDRQSRLYNADGSFAGGVVSYSSVMDFSGNIIGRSVLDGKIIDNSNQIIGYQQPNGNVNSTAGLPLGNMFKYAVAFSFDNKFIGLVLEDGSVIDSKKESVGTVDFDGYVLRDNQKIGYALYDFYVYDKEGNVIGYINQNGEVTSFTNKNLGRIDRGFLVDKDEEVIGRGNRDYNIREKSRLVLGELMLNGNVLDSQGNIIGTLGKAGEVLNRNNEVIATASPLQYYSKVASKSKKEMVFDKDGNFIGYVDENGNLVDAKGNIIGSIDKDGNIINKTGEVVGQRQVEKDVYDKEGNIIGRTNAEGLVLDANGKVIGRLNENGDVIDANGNIIGGISRNWYEKVSRPEASSKPEDVSPALKLLESKGHRKSLGIALTPDGEYLGEIMEDKSVVDKKGEIVGHLMPDGLVIDDEGTLIGVEEAKQPKEGGIFVPPGTFGDGGAYGTGSGSPGNLGPGGGYGPGERYDPMRQAALNAAMAERRKNITVGKISNGTRKEAFDGMQKDWTEQGIPKIISSWRVNMSEMILSDKPIPAVIARSIDSNNPAPITAFVERNVYAEEGRNVIIPAGSRLIGTLGGVTASTEATSESARVQISWERLIRPDGSLFVFQGLTADAQGRAGALGYVDQQLFKKYTLPVMTTSLTSATAYFMAPNDNESEYESPRQQAANDARQNFINEMNNIFDEILQDKSNIKPLTYIPAGTRIIVFPNTDLWLRNWENDQDASLQLEKPQIFIDDGEKAAEQEKKSREPTTKTVSTGGDVVYDSSMEDVESTKAPAPLVDDSKSKRKQPPGQVYIAPPPPPSASSSGSGVSTPPTTTSSGTSSSANTNNSVPALF